MYSPDYTVAASRISALKDRLLTVSQAERMISSPSAEEAFRVLSDLEWSMKQSEEGASHDFERVINAGIYEVKLLLQESSPSEDILKFLFLPFDLQNAKHIFSAVLREKKYEDIREDLSDFSYFEKRTAYDFFITDNSIFEKELFFFRDAILIAKEFSENYPEKREEALDIIDQAFFQELQRVAKKIGTSGILGYFKNYITIENIKKTLRRQQENTISLYCPELFKNHEVAIEKANSMLEDTSFRSFFIEGLESLRNGEGVLNEEIGLGIRLLEKIHWPNIENPFGPEMLLEYWNIKLKDAEIIRGILVAKRNHFSEEKIRKYMIPFLSFLKK